MFLLAIGTQHTSDDGTAWTEGRTMHSRDGDSHNGRTLPDCSFFVPTLLLLGLIWLATPTVPMAEEAGQ
jgi:hypothetical protein